MRKKLNLLLGLVFIISMAGVEAPEKQERRIHMKENG